MHIWWIKISSIVNNFWPSVLHICGGVVCMVVKIQVFWSHIWSDYSDILYVLRYPDTHSHNNFRKSISKLWMYCIFSHNINITTRYNFDSKHLAYFDFFITVSRTFSGQRRRIMVWLMRYLTSFIFYSYMRRQKLNDRV